MAQIIFLPAKYRCMIDWRIDENGVTPMPVAIWKS
jgi:hypothetical protein